MAHQRRTDLIVEEIQRLRSLGDAAAVEEDKSKFVIFSLLDSRYAFAGADVKEILPVLEIFPVPGAPVSVPGLINNRGEIEAVVDLRIVIGLPGSPPAAGSRLVMIQKSGVRAGILVDAVVDVVDLPPSAIRPPLATIGDPVRELVTGEMTHAGRGVVLLDAGRILEALRTHGR